MGAPVRIRCKRRKVRSTRHDQINVVCTKYSTQIPKHCVATVRLFARWTGHHRVRFANGLCFFLLFVLVYERAARVASVAFGASVRFGPNATCPSRIVSFVFFFIGLLQYE